MVSRDAVIWGYRLILGREPESEAAIEAHIRLPDIVYLRKSNPFWNSNVGRR